MTKTHTPLITIGIPFFNTGKYLAYAINSVLYQTYSNWELLLLDDGSTDTSLKTARYYESIDRRIKALSDGKNQGLPARLNQLSTLANGEFYCRMDADDMMHPKRLEKQLHYLIKHPKIDLLGSGLISIDNDNQITGLRKGITKERFDLKDIIKGGWAVHPTIMGKTTWFKKNKYDTTLKRAQDYDLWIRTIQTSWFSKLPEPYLYYREASTSTVKKYFKASKHARNIFRKNKDLLGVDNCIKMTIKSYIKLVIYIIYWIFGKTDKLIERRSLRIREELLEMHQIIINKTIKMIDLKQINR